MNIGEMNIKINNIELEINSIVNHLKKFSPEVLELRSPVIESTIKNFERKYNIILPYDYKYLLSITNGFTLMGNEIYGISDNISHLSMDLSSAYEFEHNDVYIPQYDYLIPFSPDGMGNFYCFDIRDLIDGNILCNIVFWQSNYIYTSNNQPEITHKNLSEYINECIIEWTLDDYDYNGNPR